MVETCQYCKVGDHQGCQAEPYRPFTDPGPGFCACKDNGHVLSAKPESVEQKLFHAKELLKELIQSPYGSGHHGCEECNPDGLGYCGYCYQVEYQEHTSTCTVTLARRFLKEE